MHQTIELIVAATPTGAIGYRDTIPWRLKGDLARFKALTMGNVVIMGKNTYRSLPGPLEGRTVIVVSKSFYESTQQIDADTLVVPSLKEALHLASCMRRHKKIFIAGGARLYEEALARIPDLIVELTTVYNEQGAKYDTVIENFDILDQFHVVSEPEGVYGDDGRLSHTYTTLMSP